MKKLKVKFIRKIKNHNKIIKVYDLTIKKFHNFLTKKKGDKEWKLVHNTSLYPTIMYNTNLSVDTIRFLIPEKIAIMWLYDREKFKKDPEEFIIYDFEKDVYKLVKKENAVMYLERLMEEEFIFTEVGAVVYPPHKKEGIFRQVIKMPVKDRKKVKPKMEEEERINGHTPLYKALYSEQYTFKVIANSVYGFAGFAKSRVFNIIIATGITIHGKFLIKFMARKVNDYLFNFLGKRKDIQERR